MLFMSNIMSLNVQNDMKDNSNIDMKIDVKRFFMEMEIKYENKIIFFVQAWMIVADASQKIEEPRYHLIECCLIARS